MFVDQFIEFSPIENSNQLTKKARTTYHDIVLLFLGCRDRLCQNHGAPTGGQIQSFFFKTVFGQECPVIEETVVMEESVIPSNAFRMLLEEQVRFKGEVWTIHKNDPDPFPSVPHAHNYESGLKMHMGIGELFWGTQLVGKIRKKKFIEIRKRFTKVKLPELTI